MTLEEKYVELCVTPSDINEHLIELKRIALQSESIVELGVRSGVSTIALLSGKPKKMTSYDVHYWPDYEKWKEVVKKDTDFTFIQADVLSVEIEEVDTLFIDTLHNYDQLKKELELHGNKAQKYLMFHDTTSFEWVGESYDGIRRKGIWPAIEEFMRDNPHWVVSKRRMNNNGLLILKRQ